MTEVEIEKLAESIARKLSILLNDTLRDDIESMINDRLGATVRLILTRYGDALVDLAKELS